MVLNGLWLFVFAVASVWLKYLAVDYAIADVLNWPTFGTMNLHYLRHLARALAVAAPSLGAALCVIVPALFFPAKRRTAALLTMLSLLTLLVMTDRLFIRYYADIFIFHDLMLVPQTGLIAKSIWALLNPWDVIVLADVPLLIWLTASGRVKIIWPAGRRFSCALLAALILAGAAVQGAAVWHIQKYRPHIIDAMYDRLSVCAWVSAGTFHWWDFFSLARKSLEPKNVPQAEIDEIAKWFDANRQLRPRGTSARNLILVQCEALQYFVVDLKVGGVEVTPNLNRFRRESLYFPNTWSQAAGGNSSDAEFMANTGLFPAAYGAAYTMFADNDFNSLARAMRLRRGARAIVVQGTKSAFWNCHRMHPKLWFHRQYSENTWPKDEKIGLGLSDGVIFSRANSLFRSMNGPFYGFIVTLSSHHPFDFDGLPDAELPMPPELKGTLIGNYLNSIHYFDAEFGRFIETLRRDGLLDKSLLVVYGDHPAIPIAYRQDMEKLLGRSLEDAVEWKKTRRIPLFIRIPERVGHAQTIETNAGQMDILPTVAGLMGLDIRTSFGNDLLNAGVRAPIVFRNGNYITKGVLVEPGVGRATELSSGQRLNEASFDMVTEGAELRLKYNDLILEKNLIERILAREK